MKERLTPPAIAVIALVIAAVVLLGSTAVAGPGGNGKGKGKQSVTTTTEAPPPPPSSANEADANFVRMMIPHHHQALVLSRLAPDRTANAELLGLAGRIDVEQTVEIGTMQHWQAFNGFDETDPESAYQMMMQDPAMIEMMGMATQAELDQLETLSDADFDQLFLELMIDHHQGAVDMAVQVMTNGQDPVLNAMANEMLTTQSTQISQMQAMLAEIG